MTELRIACPEVLDEHTGKELAADAWRKAPSQGAVELVLDLSGTRRMDSRGGAWIVDLANRLHKRQGGVRCEGQAGEVADFVRLIEPALQPVPEGREAEEGFVEELGGNLFRWAPELKEFFNLLIDAAYWTILAPFEGRGFRWNLLIEEMHEMGVRAVRIICLMNFLLGLIIAMLSAAQVESFGMGIYVAYLVVIAFARELAAVMTATVVSARTGAAITAEIATMKVQEEIDALRGMGLNVTQFLVAPKLVALTIVMPCLTALGLVSGVLGGSVWGILVLGFRPKFWFIETMKEAHLNDIFQGQLKCLCFAVVICMIGCHNGLRVQGGSRGVGLMTTRSVVMDIFFIILIDMIFAAVFYYVL